VLRDRGYYLFHGIANNGDPVTRILEKKLDIDNATRYSAIGR
jgi:hypothetical protein